MYPILFYTLFITAIFSSSLTSFADPSEQELKTLMEQVLDNHKKLNLEINAPRMKCSQSNPHEDEILSSILDQIKPKYGCPHDKRELTQRMQNFISKLDRLQNTAKIFDTKVQEKRKARFSCVFSHLGKFADKQTPVTLSDFKPIQDSIASCNPQIADPHSDHLSLDEIPNPSDSTPIPHSIPPAVRSVYQDIFKTMDLAKKEHSTPPYSINLLVPGNNDLSNAAYVAMQVKALEEYQKIHHLSSDQFHIGCITMGFGGYPTTAEFPNTMVVEKVGGQIKKIDNKPVGTGIPEARALATVIKNMSGLQCEQEENSTTTGENVTKVNTIVGKVIDHTSPIVILSGAETGAGRQADIFANNLDPRIKLYALPMRRSQEHLRRLPFRALAYHYFNGIKEVFGDYICQIQNCGGPSGYSLIGVKPLTPELQELLQSAVAEINCFSSKKITELDHIDVNALGNTINEFKDKIQADIPKALQESEYMGAIEKLGKDPIPVLSPILGN